MNEKRFATIEEIKETEADICGGLQKQRRMHIAQEMLTTFKDDPDLLKTIIITGDESWTYGYEIETKA